MATAIAVRYARALAEVVTTPGCDLEPRAAVAQLNAFHSLVHSSEELQHVLHSPAVPASRKRAVIQVLCGQLAVHAFVRNILWVLSDHHRIGALKDVEESFEAVVDEKLGMVKAEIATAAPLAPDLRDRLSSALTQTTGRTVRCEYADQPELLGGVQVKIGSKIFDGSVRGRLERLRRQLMAEAG